MLRPKSSVRYRMGGAHCGMCEYFENDASAYEPQSDTGTCKLVEGKIGEDMLCDLFKPKANSAAPPASGKPSFAQKANVY